MESTSLKESKNGLLRFAVGTNEWLVVVFNFLVTGIVATACILRYVFTKDMAAFEEFLIPIAFWLYMTGGINGSAERSHICADILSSNMKDGLRRDVVIVVRGLLTIALSATFMVWAFKAVMWYIQIGQRSPVWHVPAWLAYSSIFVGMLMMTVFHIIHSKNDIQLFIKRNIKTNKVLETKPE